MGRSQRHKVEEQGFSSSGAIYEEGAICDEVLGAIGGAVVGARPILTSINPATAVLGSADVTMHCIGSNFTADCQINFAGHLEPIVFVSATDISTVVKPSLGWGPVTVPVQVMRGPIPSADTKYFTFTATELQEEGRRGEERTFPLGPFSLLRLEPSESPFGVWFVLGPDDGENLREGDQLLIEATGSSATNGNYTVTQLTNNGDTRFFVPDLQIAALVEGKGRVTVNAGA